MTGWAFALFVFVSVSWILAGLLTDNQPIALQNVAMLLVNVRGVYQYLLNPRNKKEIEIAEQCTVKTGEELETAEG